MHKVKNKEDSPQNVSFLSGSSNFPTSRIQEQKPPLRFISESVPSMVLNVKLFEVYEQHFSDPHIDKDSLSSIIKWPEDDVVVEEQTHNIRTIQHIPGLREGVREQDVFIDYVLKFFEKNWVIVKKKYEMYSLTNYGGVEDLKDIYYYVDSPNAEPSDKPESSAIKNYSSDIPNVSSINELAITDVTQDRFCLFSSYLFDNLVKNVNPFSFGKGQIDRLAGIQILVKPLELEFEIGYIEPLYGSISLYDLEKKEKISETWNFDLNPQEILRMIDINPKNRDPIASSKVCIFNLAYANPNIYMFITVSKTLLRASSCASEIYLNPKAKKKELDKCVNEIQQNTAFLRKYHHTFGYAAVQLFSDEQTLATSKVEMNGLFRFKLDKDIFSCIEKALDKSSKAKVQIPARVSIELKMLKDDADVGPRCTHNLQMVKSANRQPDTPIVREMADFTYIGIKNNKCVVPFVNYENSMYLLPEQANFSHYSGNCKNVVIKFKMLEDDDDLQKEGLPLFYGTSVQDKFTNTASTNVTYHNNKKRPLFFEEIKLELPVSLTSKHHIVASFYHVQCHMKKSNHSDDPNLLPIGYALIKLYPDGKILNDGVYHLPIALSLPSSDYLSLYPALDKVDSLRVNSETSKNVKWLDAGKPLFTIGIKAISSIYFQDHYLVQLVDQYKAFREQSHDLKTLHVVLKDLVRAHPSKLIAHFPVVFDILFFILSFTDSATQNEVYTQLLNAAMTIQQNSEDYGSKLLENYVEYMFELVPNASHSLPNVLLELWYLQFIQTQDLKSSSVICAWFLFKLLYKAMVLMLRNDKKPYIDTKNRSERFSGNYLFMLKFLIRKCAILIKQHIAGIKVIRPEPHAASNLITNTTPVNSSSSSGNIGARVNRDAAEAKADPVSLHTNFSQPEDEWCKDLCKSAALFLRDLLSILDRGVVCSMIFSFISTLDTLREFTLPTVFYKFYFMRIICDYEHYIPLNLPLKNPVNFTSVTEIQQQYYQRHLLSTLLLSEVFECSNLQSGHRQRFIAIQTLRDLFIKHDMDPRYSAPEKKSRIAEIYFLYVILLSERWEVMKTYSDMNSEEESCWLVCFLWILKHVDIAVLKSWWNSDKNADHHLGFLSSLASALSIFEYRGAAELSKSEAVGRELSTESSRDIHKRDEDKDRRAKKKRSFKPKTVSSMLNQVVDKDLITYTQDVDYNQANRLFLKKISFMYQLPVLTRKMQNLTREVSLIVLYSLAHWICHYHSALLQPVSDGSGFVLSGNGGVAEAKKSFVSSFLVFVSILSSNQAFDVIELTYKHLKWLIPYFKRPLFRYRSGVCGSLTHAIVSMENSNWPSIRSMANDLFFLMIKMNMSECKQFSRMKLQIGVAISEFFARQKLDRVDGDEPLKYFLQDMPKYLTLYFKDVSSNQGDFLQEVKVLLGRVEKTIKTNVKMAEYRFDPESMIDLYYRISLSYVDSPDLRLPELEKIALMLEHQGQYEECAMVRITQAILVAEYLRLLSRFNPIYHASKNNLIYEALIKDLVLPKRSEIASLEQEICQSEIFTENGFLNYLQQAISNLRKISIFESCIEVYNLTLPIYQVRHDYEKLCVCYGDLYQLCKFTTNRAQANNRIFAQYYRVAYFGNNEKFQDLNGKQFIYKELASSRLDTIQTHLTEQFLTIIPEDYLHFVSNTKSPEDLSITPNHLYIQLVSVTPYFSESELMSRPTLYEQHQNINRFVYEIPFSTSSSSEKLSDQWKHKFILTVDGFFPCIKKRLPISHVEVVDISPIQGSIELIQRKAQALSAELNSLSKNTKTLQRELQGTLLIQVNAGPAAIAREFLAANADYPLEKKKELRSAFIEFLKLLAEGLEINSRIIGEDQQALQNELEKGYFMLKQLICKLTDTPISEIQEGFLSQQ
ncbi:dedicator of cytokinesis protein 8-like [Schistocerca gregaria]|uniref:dedicator of cytokinesis protein 8-like n=1 Tax=Schistocerca gregaria TaxID=7010 RepID=UPI00211F1848|nr:dedicator of cytokinesis protein 8-like [Schistocerca gregaria]